MVFSLATVAFAADSPSGKPTVSVDTSSSNANAGSVQKAENKDGSVTLTATAAKGYTFKGWTITGEYTIVSGSLNSANLVIKASGDCVVKANFSGTGAAGDGSGTGPETGYSIALLVFAGAVSLAGASFAMKKARA